ncbi:Hypothetical protein LUCI_3987 [Lucifera butyrica]|uniref:UPF0291 protein LUCI_3987 n=1 Tax=Lucifera butyrica TaxID=1351585 RepID=A0A498RBT8_9FIRM|nr:DUF896 domain-containing protein [Lucifera butyrica]VBB08709.1 Hypothetical protein LUCI_3987 [Lucifera butyrica]
MSTPITPELINRINELARKQKTAGLSAEEQDEQARLRRIYIDNIKEQVRAQLDAVRKDPHPDHCDCGCHHQH